jgi:hypothetical protein
LADFFAVFFAAAFFFLAGAFFFAVGIRFPLSSGHAPAHPVQHPLAQ